MIDIHNHLIPGVDDGAGDLASSRDALGRMHEQGVLGVVTTPHLQGSITQNPSQLAEFFERVDPAWANLQSLRSEQFPELNLERGVEIMLDAPTLDLSDDRLRLAGSRFVLVEFPHMVVPPNSAPALFDLKMRGWSPIVAHPERYSSLDDRLEIISEWRRVGALLQVNCGSLVGRYGTKAKITAWRLLRRGWVDYLSSDYHGRGRFSNSEAWAILREKGGVEQAELLLSTNAGLLLRDAVPEAVPPLLERRPTIWRRMWSRSRH